MLIFAFNLRKKLFNIKKNKLKLLLIIYYYYYKTNIIKLLYIITISLNYVMLFKYFKITFFANLVSCKVTFLFGKHECKTLDWKRNEDL